MIMRSELAPEYRSAPVGALELTLMRFGWLRQSTLRHNVQHAFTCKFDVCTPRAASSNCVRTKCLSFGAGLRSLQTALRKLGDGSVESPASHPMQYCNAFLCVCAVLLLLILEA